MILSGSNIWDKVLSIVLVLVIVGALGALGYVIVTPKVGETFTEFYILGPEGEAADYPTELEVGEEGKVVLGIVNHEGEDVRYRVEVVTGGENSPEPVPVALGNEEIWEGEVAFVMEIPGDGQKVEFLLYRENEAEPLLEPLYLWVNVSENMTEAGD